MDKENNRDFVRRGTIMDIKNLPFGEKLLLAETNDTNQATLWELAQDKDSWVRRRIANNLNSSSKILVRVFGYEKTLKVPIYPYLNKKAPSFRWGMNYLI